MKNKIELIVLPQNRNKNFSVIEIIKSFINDYCDRLIDVRQKEIMFKRFGLNDDKLNKLVDLGIYFNLSRERIRQIQNKHLSNIKKLLMGHTLNQLNCKASIEIMDIFNDFRKYFEQYRVIDGNLIDVYLKNGTISMFNEYEKNYIYLLLCSINFKICITNENEILVSKYKCEFLEKFKSYILDILHKEVIPISCFDLYLKVKRNINFKKLNNFEIEQIIKLSKGIATTNVNGETKIEIDIALLKNVNDQAYRVLYEENKIMHYNDLKSEIQNRILNSRFYQSKYGLTKNLRLSVDKRFVSIGRTGFWSLAAWNQNQDTIIDLISKALYFFNKPVYKEEIIKYIKNIRTNINEKTIGTILISYKNNFLKLEDGRFILTEWKNKYANKIDKNANNNLVLEEFNSIIVNILQDGPKSLNDIYDKLTNRVKYNKGTLSNRLTKSDLIIKEKKEKGTVYRLVNNYEEKLLLRKESKSDQIYKSIQNYILINKNKSIKLSEIVKYLTFKYGFPKASIYKIIDTNANFVKKKIKNVLYIQSDFGQSEVELSVFDKLLEKLKSGENDSLELKSTLRWDLKRNIVNKDLEFEVSKTINAFLNSEGGELYIGVNDNSQIIGLEYDYNTFKKKNKDGFQLHLINNVINLYFKKSIHDNLNISIVKLNDKEICCINVSKSATPVFLFKDGIELFYIRTSGSSQALSLSELVTYNKSHWS